MGKQWKQWQTLFFWAPKSLKMVTAVMKLRRLLLGRKAMTNLDSILKKQRHCQQSYGFSSSYVWMWELDYKESWVLKNWCFWTVMLENSLESPLDCKEVKPVHPKRNQSWIFFGRTDAEDEAPILWPPDAKNWLIGKDPDTGKNWRQEEKGTTEDEMAGWHHQLGGLEFAQVPGVGDGQGSLECCSPCGRKELNMTELLKWTGPGEIPNTQRFVFHYFCTQMFITALFTISKIWEHPKCHWWMYGQRRCGIYAQWNTTEP